MAKEENYKAYILGMRKAIFFNDADQVLEYADKALSNLVPSYAQEIKKRKLREQQKILKDIRVVNEFEKLMEQDANW
jgi:hypothetical protein